MLNSIRRYALIPSGKHQTVENLLQYANSIPTFTSVNAAQEWLSFKTDIDNKDYIQIVEISITMDEKKCQN